MTHSENESEKSSPKRAKIESVSTKVMFRMVVRHNIQIHWLVAQKMQTTSLLVSLHQKNFMLKNGASNAQKVRKGKFTQAHQTRSDMHTQQTVYNVLFILY